MICRSPAEVAGCRGSKYDVVAVNTLLRTVLDEPGRYVLVGLPCHIQGLRLAQRRSRRLRERVVLALGIFCGLTGEPRATEVAALQAGLDLGGPRLGLLAGPAGPAACAWRRGTDTSGGATTRSTTTGTSQPTRRPVAVSAPTRCQNRRHIRR